MKLISMTSFIEEQEKLIPATEHGSVKEWDRVYVQRTISYCRFLRQPLTFGMFVPVDEDGNILNEPFYDPANEQYWASERFAYDTAKENVLFEGFELRENMITDGMNDVYFMKSNGKFSKHCLMGNDIEYMVYWDLELTPSALKQIGL